MKIIRSAILLFTLLLVSLNVRAINSKIYTSLNGLIGNTVMDMIQDDQGYIWMGTTCGLSRFDGYSFLNFNTFTNLQGKKTASIIGLLYIDHQNHLLWISSGTYDNGCYDLRRSRFVTYNRPVKFVPLKKRFLSTQGMWFYDSNTCARQVIYNGKNLSVIDYTKENHKLPSNHVSKIIEDADSNVWLCTNHGVTVVRKDNRARILNADDWILDMQVYHHLVLLLTKDDDVLIYGKSCRLLSRTHLPSVIGSINKVTNTLIWKGQWLIFTPRITYAFDIHRKTFSKPAECQIPEGTTMDYDKGYYFVSDKIGDLWIFMPDGQLRKLDIKPKFSIFSSSKRYYRACIGPGNQIYISTSNGLYIYDPRKRTLRHYLADDDETIIPSNFLSRIIVDRSGDIWIAADDAGIVRLSTPKDVDFQYIYPSAYHLFDQSNMIQAIAAEGADDIVFSTRDNVLYHYNLLTRQITRRQTFPYPVYTYCKDKRGNTWVGTRGGGLYINGKHYTREDKKNPIPCDDIFDILADPQGRIWIATDGSGLLQVNYTKGKALEFRQFLNQNINESRIQDLSCDSRGRLWVGTYDGLFCLNTHKKNLSDRSFLHFSLDNHQLPTNEVSCINTAKDGTIWIGTGGVGVIHCRLAGNRLEYDQINTQQGLSNNYIHSIASDLRGGVWIGTEGGLSYLKRNGQKPERVRTYQLSQDFRGNIFSDNSALLLPDGQLLFGTNHGLAVIRPLARERNISMPFPVRITDLRINGVSIFNNDSDTKEFLQLREAVSQQRPVSLSHRQNSLSIHFSDFNFAEAGTTGYQYYLEPLQTSWKPYTTRNHVSYDNLSPGSYTFHLRSINANGHQSKEIVMKITIRHPWYSSWWAWIIYLMLMTLAACYVYHNLRERVRFHQQLTVNHQISEFRINFFTHIAHEFRTPLAIIQNAVEQLVDPETGQVSKSAVQASLRGTHRLLRLVNQLMEFRKISTGNQRLSIEKDDIIGFIRRIYQDFWSYSRQKEINMSFIPFAKKHNFYFDHEMLETMVYNLLSNAIKYTPEKGQVTLHVSLSTDGCMLLVKIANTGTGISPEQQETLFQPFMHGYVSQGGMGIGLYNAHEMARLHHGNLTYARDQDTNIFTLSLPENTDVYQASDFKTTIAVNADKEDERQEQEQMDTLIREVQPEAFNHQKVIIIEDDPDMMLQLKETIGRYFSVSGYMSGDTGYEGVRKELPALVLCDVMLPDRNGYSIVRQLRQEENTRDIPVIMLTSLDDEEHQIKGYESGADDYMVKPCNYRLLIIRICQLIRWHEGRETPPQVPVRQEASPATLSEHSQPVLITSTADKRFLSRMDSFIDEHFDDPNFNVDQLATLMCIGRTTFYGKAKELLGISPRRYLINQRLNKAAQLLRDGTLSISEVSYKTGFSSPQYFNRCFKDHFGTSPSQYSKK
ncbi:MAG: response regulator [Prevotella sp.]|jgi:ligand-binding sensor domain-containing protein/AraC-like DNA-binding protein/nitrogen-specific signal transduction histidine kinase|nr:MULTISPECIES: hybrid sensor histidine kinase/response regulator transcription factor [unclassified Prevotella]MCH3993173.1 response regulator [Prevotella sp.]MCH4100826.1 response regulator [Prevotella sp.]MCH4186136.1 response regulator [Prevotella sp.]MCH4215883.1 response regulator [Prevotella sp.]MCI1449941.1 response regulator [Prevotella sp.]